MNKSSKKRGGGGKRNPSKRSKPQIGQKGKNKQKQVGINRKLNQRGKPMSFEKAFDKRHGNGIRVRGSDYVSAINITDTQLPGSEILNLPVCPSSFTGTRLAQFSPLFERYKVNKWTFTYIPAVPSTVPGQLLMYPEYDIEDELPGNLTERLRQGVSHLDSVMFNVYSEASVSFGSLDPYTDLFTDGTGEDQRLTYAGLLRVLNMTTLELSASAGTYGTIHMDYDIEFYLPQLQEQSSPVLLGDGQLKAEVSSTAANQIFSDILISGLGALERNTIYEALIDPVISLAWSGQKSGNIPLNGQSTIFFKTPAVDPITAVAQGVEGFVQPARTFAEALLANISSDVTSTGTHFTSSVLSNLSGSTIVPGTTLGKLTNVTKIPLTSYSV